MLEMIRKQLMRRYQLKRDGIRKLKGKLCPRIVEKLESICKAASNCLSHFSVDGMFEVEQESRQYVVDIRNRKCRCRKWQMTGIPCAHAHSAITFHGHHPEDCVDPCYSIEMSKRPMLHSYIQCLVRNSQYGPGMIFGSAKTKSGARQTSKGQSKRS
jgi:hypothetical protein